MDENETPINGKPRRARRLRAAGSRGFRGFEERLIWPVEDAARAVFDLVRRPFEWIAWTLQRWLIWPLQDRFDGLGRPARAVAALASVVAIAAAVAVGIGLAGSGGSAGEPASELVAEPAPAIAAAPAEPASEEESAPTLEGADPVFESAGSGKKKSKSGSKGSAEAAPSAAATESAPTESASGSAATDTISSSPSASASAGDATVSSSAAENGRPAGKKAVAVAREFADAFVVYETGGDKAEVRKAFAATATKALTRSLLKRPPRLPANAKVPKAKVVNVVPGPSRQGVYPVSVSLLRVGLTSELRLEMELLNGKRWRVTNVLG